MKRRNLVYTTVIFLAFVIFAAVNTSHSMLLSELIDSFGLTSAQQGSAYTLQNIGCLAALFLMLPLTGRIRKPLLYILTMAVMFGSLLPMSFAPNYPVFTAACGLMGLAMGFVDTLSSSMIADMYKGERASGMMCILHAIFGVGSIASTALIGALQGRGVTWDRVYLLYGVTGMVFAVLILLPTVMQLRRTDLPKESRAKVSGRDFREIWKTPAHRTVLILVLCYGTAQGGLQSWMDRFVDVGLGGTLGTLSMLLWWIGLTVSRLSSSVLKIPALTYVRWGSAAGAAVIAAGIFSGEPVVMCICSGLYTLVCGSVVPIALAHLCNGFHGNSLFATTLVMACNFAGQAAGPALIGAADSLWGMRAGMCVGIAAIALCAATAFLSSRKTENAA